MASDAMVGFRAPRREFYLIDLRQAGNVEYHAASGLLLDIMQTANSCLAGDQLFRTYGPADEHMSVTNAVLIHPGAHCRACG